MSTKVLTDQDKTLLFSKQSKIDTSEKNKDFYDRLYLNNYDRHSFQWELWTECNNRCKFCYLGDENKQTLKERQLHSIEDLTNAINSLDFTYYNNVSLIGGEFFQGEIEDKEVEDKFIELMQLLIDCYKEEKIGSIWLTVTLTLGDNSLLYKVLDMFEQNGCFPNKDYPSSGLWLCSSWDSYGRFHTQKMKDTWDFHMRNIYEKYPWVKFNTTIILTEDFINDYFSKEWEYNSFTEQYHTTVFFKQPGTGMWDDPGDSVDDNEYCNRLLEFKQYCNSPKERGNFFPKRKLFLKFLRDVCVNYPEMYNRLYNIEYRADSLNTNRKENDTTNIVRDKKNDDDGSGRKMKCNHTFTYACYSDSNECCLCDKLIVYESLM